MRTAIVTAADANYVPFLTDLLDSIDRHQRISSRMDVCVLDIGLSPEQKAALAKRVTTIVEPGWLLDFPGRETAPRYMQGQLARAFYPQLFPAYERFVHLDADVWLQDWRAMELLLLPSQGELMAIVPEIHRAYSHNYRVDRAVVDTLRRHYVGSFGENVANQLTTLPIINSGVWAMRSDLPSWKVWADILREAMNRFAGPLTEQCALNAALYTGKIAYYALPAWCNWNCAQATPLFDVDSRLFHEPMLPHDLISMVHMNGVKATEVEVLCTDGTTRKMALTYSAARKK
jgi:lipopolysaccharide biosynthesis glycosyltransferase